MFPKKSADFKGRPDPSVYRILNWDNFKLGIIYMEKVTERQICYFGFTLLEFTHVKCSDLSDNLLLLVGISI